VNGINIVAANDVWIEDSVIDGNTGDGHPIEYADLNSIGHVDSDATTPAIDSNSRASSGRAP